jgi:hypothetical protein
MDWFKREWLGLKWDVSFETGMAELGMEWMG